MIPAAESYLLETEKKKKKTKNPNVGYTDHQSNPPADGTPGYIISDPIFWSTSSSSIAASCESTIGEGVIDNTVGIANTNAPPIRPQLIENWVSGGSVIVVG